MSNLAQVFYISPSSVKNSDNIGISSVDLYFYSKPKITGNKSGIYAPGVEISLCETVNGVPKITPLTDPKTGRPFIARREYVEINSSLDASVPCKFIFKSPIKVNTEAYYGLIIRFDGNEDFTLWECKNNEFLIGTTTDCTGPSGKYVGKLYGYNGPSTADLNSVYSPDNWKAYDQQDLKFSVYVARYSTDGTPNISSSNSNYISMSGNTTVFTAPVIPTEFISFDKKTSVYDPSALAYGDTIYQTQQFYPAGYANSATCSLVANDNILTLNSFTYTNSSAASWTDIFTNTSAYREFIVIKSLNHYGVNQHAIAVRKVVGISANSSVLFLNEKIPFSNNSAKFFKAPVGILSGLSNSFISGNLTNLMILSQSNANATVRFVNNCITNTSIVANGASYSNSDFILITGYENVPNEVLGGYNATANIVTNANGSIIQINTANAGAGFVNGYSYSIRNAANSASSNGTGANLAFTFGCTLYSRLGQDQVYFNNCKIINIEASQITPQIGIDFPDHTQHSISFNTMYYANPSANTTLGKTYLVDQVALSTPINLKNEYTETFGANTPVVVSRSNQFVVGYANGAIPTANVIGAFYSNVASYSISATSINDFSMIKISPEVINSFYSKYSINNDYTNENTDYGNAISKHVTTKITFDQDQRAEDLIVYLTAYRPPGTDFKVFGRVFNSQDNDTFDDKDWSLLEIISGNNIFSNPANTSDMFEYTYNFPAYPNTDFTFAGTAMANLNSTLITGFGTTFNANLAVNDLVKIYSPLFANTNYILAAVSSITNATSFNIATPIANAGVTGAGLKVDRIKYPHQAFNNMTSANVARYYDANMAERDTFDSFQVKLVLLSNNQSIVPRIDDCKVVGCTA